MLFFAVCWGVLFSWLPTPATVVLNEQHHNQTVSIAYPDTITVELRSQPGTGHYWTWVPSEAAGQPLALVSQETTPVHHVPGGESRQRFHFRAQQTGRTTLTLHLIRPWEDSVLQTYSVHLQIR